MLRLNDRKISIYSHSGILLVPWQKPPSKRRREIIVPKSASRQGARPIRAETRAKLVASIARLSAIEAKVAALAYDPFLHQKHIRIQAIGRLDLLPERVVAAIREAETATAQYNSMTLTIAVGYGGREEIADAVRTFIKIQERQGASLSDVIERITPEAIACHLYAADLPDPDLIIRTSGEIRLSGFLLWQSVHSEFYFTDVLWPAFRKVDFLRAIRFFVQCGDSLCNTQSFPVFAQMMACVVRCGTSNGEQCSEQDHRQADS
jgi:undecaprenyl diphosphate synthase